MHFGKVDEDNQVFDRKTIIHVCLIAKHRVSSLIVHRVQIIIFVKELVVVGKQLSNHVHPDINLMETVVFMHQIVHRRLFLNK